MTKPACHFFAAIFALLSAAARAQSPATPAVITRGPYLQAAAPDSIHMVWRVRQDTQPVVHYGTAPQTLDQQTEEKAVTVRRLAAGGASTNGALPLHSAPPETRQYEAKITGLKPDTRYYYAIHDGATRLTPDDGNYYFHTLPESGKERPLLMWVVGDSGTGNRVQSKVHTAMRDWLTKEKRELDLYLHVGDMAYSKGLDTEFQGYFFQVYQETLRNTVCWPVIGNHEGKTSVSATGTGPYYDSYVVPAAGESGGVPSGTEQYYAFDTGRVHFIALNSFDTSRASDGAMAQWLKADLEKTKADWIIAFFHHPPYTKGSHDSDDRAKDKELVEMRENIMPILEAGGVDLVLAGHSHIYERSFLLDGAYNTPTTAENSVLNDGDGDPGGDGPYSKSAGITPHHGSISIVAGHGGATMGRKKNPSPVMRVSILEFGSLLLDLKGDTVTGRMLNSDGVIRDTFQLIKRGRVELAHIAKPKSPQPFIGRTLPLPRIPSAGRSTPDKGAVMPEKFTAVIPRGAEWQYLGGTDPGAGWSTSLEGDWKTGQAGFGYEDDDDVTKITGMQGKYKFLCIRRAFELTGREDLSRLGLAISFDDGFICYLNGNEVARANVKSGSLQTATGVESHETKGFKFFPLRQAQELLKPGRNMIAFEIHNDDIGSSDLTIDPYLILTEAAATAEGGKPHSDLSSDE